ncbi:TPA: dienelactone hydrolase family protein [Klebsiella oxytoca]
MLTPTSASPFTPQTLMSEDRGTYRAEKLAFNVTDENRIAALMLTPKSAGPHPAIVLLHDHGSKFDIGKEKLIRPLRDAARLASAEAWADKFFSGRFIGDELAQRGYVVIAIDSPGWGDRGPMTYEQQQALASNYFNLGRSLAGEVAYEDLRTVNFVSTLKEVDNKRIGVLGFSMGGFRAWQLAALTDKVAATAAISWFGTWNGLMQPGNNVLRGQSAFYMLHPGLAGHLDIPDIASIAAPRPMLIYSGGQDKLFPAAAVNDAFAKVHNVWASQNAQDKLETRTWPELGHVFYQEQQDEVFPWLDKWLKP